MKICSVWIPHFLVLMGAVVTGSVVAAEAAKDVADLYLKHCSICHGDKGNAQTRAQSGMTPKPRDFTTAEAAMELTRDRMIHSVTNGRPGTAMVGHKGRLSEVQIAAIVDYVRANFMQVPLARQGGSPEAVSLGEKVYTKNCSVCHGDDGNSAFWAKNGLNPPPRDFTSPEAQSVLTRERMINSVTHGRPGTGMMPFSTRLSKEEIAAVVGFIRFTFMGVEPGRDRGSAPMAQVAGSNETVTKSTENEAHKTSPHAGDISGVDMPLVSENMVSGNMTTSRPATDPHAQTPQGALPAMGMPGTMSGTMPGDLAGGHKIDIDMTETIPNKLKGDVKWGREFYMKNCFSCHGVKGDGNGPRAYFNTPRPRNFTSDASRQILNRPRIFDSISKGRVGTVMPAWGQVLNEQEIANLTEFVFQAFIQSKGAAAVDKTSKAPLIKKSIEERSKDTDKKKAS